MKSDARFEQFPWKNVWLYFISICGVDLGHKIGKFWKSHRILHYSLILKKITSDLNMSCQTVPDLVYALLFQINFGNRNFKHYWNGLIFFNYGICCQIKIYSPFFLLLFVNSYQLRKFIMILIYIETLYWNFCV